MNILCAGHYYHVKGGSDRYLVELAELLSSKGESVIPFSVNDVNNLPTAYSKFFPQATNTEKPGVLDMIQYNYSYRANRAIKKLLRSHPIDIAHLHIYYGQLTTAILRPLRDKGIPIVQTLHEYKLTCPVYTHISNGTVCERCQGSDFSQAIRNKCKGNALVPSIAVAVEAKISRALGDVRHIDHFIAPSEFMRNMMVNQGVVAADNITKLGYHIDTEKYRPSDGRGEFVLYFGRLAEVKGVRTLIDAVAGTNIKLVIAGDGPLREELQEKIENLSSKNIEIVGFKKGSELFDLVHKSICTVLPSEWYDNLPLAILESMSSGKPVVGARIGGIPEMINHNEDGILFDSGDISGLRKALQTLWDDPDLAIDMGLKAREKMKAQFNPDDHYRQVRALYKKLM